MNEREIIQWLETKADQCDKEAAKVIDTYPHVASIEMGKAAAFRQAAAWIAEQNLARTKALIDKIFKPPIR